MTSTTRCAWARRFAVAAAALLTLQAASIALAAPGSLTATPTVPAPRVSAGVDAEIEAKEAEKAKALAEVEAMKADLARQVGAYVTLGRQLERTRSEIVEVTLEIEQMDSSLLDAEAALTRRAIELYRTDRIGMIELILTAESVSDLVNRVGYLNAINSRDAGLITQVRLARQESLWLQESLATRIDQLQSLQGQADVQRSQIESGMAAQLERANAIGADIVALMRLKEVQAARGFSGSAPSGEFNPDMVISDVVYRDRTSMSVAEIQKFLEQQPGALKYYRGKDYAGRDKTAAQMVAEAGMRWNVSPKVILVTMQKEQSLLERKNPSQRSLDWAMGCGKADSRTFYQYQGFGKQIWFGAQKLSENARPWRPGIQMKIDGNYILPSNPSTYSLYKYTPHFKGTMSFWLLYWRYFGDPLSTPPVTPGSQPSPAS